jgi:16S rRNA (adenine1518-N6/adenine1519-N6)-dimethyltransferase
MSVDKNVLTSKIDSLPPLRDVIKTHHLRAEKKFGQNFLLDLNVTEKIVRLSGDLKNTHIFEIGPGPGGLTRALLKSDADYVSAIEIDPRAIEALEDLKKAAAGQFELLQGDALTIDILKYARCDQIAVIANLPYNVATPLLLKWLECIYAAPEKFRCMSLMFQKEVAQRIVAASNDKVYGRLSIMAQWLCEVKMLFDLPPNAFTPPPKVYSSIVHFTPKKHSSRRPHFKTVEKLTAQAFGQRRKMIRASLKPYTCFFKQCGLDETWRAENIKVQHFLDLALAIEAEK